MEQTRPMWVGPVPTDRVASPRIDAEILASSGNLADAQAFIKFLSSSDGSRVGEDRDCCRFHRSSRAELNAAVGRPGNRTGDVAESKSATGIIYGSNALPESNTMLQTMSIE